MPRQILRKPASWAKHGPNARKDMGDPEKAKALALSRITNQVHPLIARTDGTLIDGFRTVWGLELLNRLDAELDFIVTDEELKPHQIAIMQGVSAIHREDWALADKCEWVIDLLKTVPAKDIAGELGVDPGMVSKWRAYEKCTAEVKEQVKAGKIGLRDMLAIAALPPDDQPVLLGLKLGGATAEETERQSRKKRNAEPAVRVAKIKCPLPDGRQVTVAGDELSLEEAVETLGDAAKAMRDAIKRGLTAKTFAAAMKDIAAAG